MTRRQRLCAALLPAAITASLLGGVTWAPPRPRLLWNASASAPIGLYRLHFDRPAAVGEMVVVTPPLALAQVMAGRGYLPAGVPLLKHVAALSGAVICRRNATVSVNGHAIAVAHAADSHGRPLPVWHGCHRLRAGEMFVLNAAADSFDGRYFGPLPTANAIGRATPVLTRDAPDQTLRWRSSSSASAFPTTTNMETYRANRRIPRG